MTGLLIQARWIRDTDLGGIITVPRYSGLTGRLEAVTVAFRQVFLTLDGFEHIVAPDERVSFDPVTEARLVADVDRRWAVHEARAIQQQSILFRTIPNWEVGS